MTFYKIVGKGKIKEKYVLHPTLKGDFDKKVFSMINLRPESNIKAIIDEIFAIVKYK